SLVTLEKESVEVEPMYFDLLRDMRVIKGTFDDIMEQTSDDYIFFELEDDQTIMEAMNRLRKRYPNAMGLEYSNLQRKETGNAAQSQRMTKQISLPELFDAYYETYREAPLNDDQREAVMSVFQAIGKEEDK